MFSAWGLPLGITHLYLCLRPHVVDSPHAGCEQALREPLTLPSSRGRSHDPLLLIASSHGVTALSRRPGRLHGSDKGTHGRSPPSRHATAQGTRTDGGNAIHSGDAGARAAERHGGGVYLPGGVRRNTSRWPIHTSSFVHLLAGPGISRT